MSAPDIMTVLDAVMSELLEHSQRWSMLAVAEFYGVALVHVPAGFIERICAPDPTRADMVAPHWLQAHPQDAKLVVEVPYDASPHRRAQAVARAVLYAVARDRGCSMRLLTPERCTLVIQRLCTRYPWALPVQQPAASTSAVRAG